MEEVWGVTKLVIFCGPQKYMNPKWFKITTNAIIGGSSFFFSIKSDIWWLQENKLYPLLTPPSTSLITKPKRLLLSVVTYSFIWKKIVAYET